MKEFSVEQLETIQAVFDEIVRTGRFQGCKLTMNELMECASIKLHCYNAINALLTPTEAHEEETPTNEETPVKTAILNDFFKGCK